MMADVRDLYLERGNGRAMDQYPVDNGWRRFETGTKLISVTPDFPAALRNARPPVKTTLRRTMHGPVISDAMVQLITLHYHPKGGTIHFDDSLVDKAALEACRRRISAVFSDYYLFDRLLGLTERRNQL